MQLDWWVLLWNNFEIHCGFGLQLDRIWNHSTTTLWKGQYWSSSTYEFNDKECGEMGEWDELVDINDDVRTIPSRAQQTNYEIYRIL